MGKEFFKRPLYAPKAQTYSSGIDSTAGFVASAGGLDVPVFTAATGTTLVSYGIHSLTGTSDTPNYALAAPQAGRDVQIVSAGGATSSAQCTVTLAAGAYIKSSQSTTATRRKITFADADDVVSLMGISTAIYVLTASVGSPTIGTT